ncbi:hypothetical protein V8G54_018962, partial [Vigna mungo]
KKLAVSKFQKPSFIWQLSPVSSGKFQISKAQSHLANFKFQKPSLIWQISNFISPVSTLAPKPSFIWPISPVSTLAHQAQSTLAHQAQFLHWPTKPNFYIGP